MKKFISVALVASMVASMGVTAFADTQYPYKDKQLEFYSDFFYDGKGADEFWVPIVVKDGNTRRFITDSKSVAENPLDAVNKNLEQANIAYGTMLAVYGKAETLNAQTFDSVAAVDEWVETNMVGLPTYTVSKLDPQGKTISDEDADLYKTQVYKALITKVVPDYVDLAQNHIDMIKMLGGEAELNEQTYQYELTVAPTDETAPVLYDDIEDVNDVEVNWKAKRGGNLVADVYVDEVEDLGDIYCVVFELTDHLGIAVQYIDGTLKMENGKNRELDEQDIRYNYYGKAAFSVVEYQMTVGDLENGYEVNGTDNYINLVDFNEKYHYVFFKKNVDWVEIEDNQGFYYEVDLSEQGKINLVYNNEAIDAVTEIASTDAVLAFYNFEARPTFDFSGKVTLTPPDEFLEEKSIEELYLYTYEKDGSLKRVKQAKVGEDGDTLEFRTATLGKFVLSSEELTLLSNAERAALEAMKEAEANGEAVVEEEAAVVVEENKANPGTGC